MLGAVEDDLPGARTGRSTGSDVASVVLGFWGATAVDGMAVTRLCRWFRKVGVLGKLVPDILVGIFALWLEVFADVLGVVAAALDWMPEDRETGS